MEAIGGFPSAKKRPDPPDSFAPLLKDGYINAPKVFFCPAGKGAVKGLAGFPTNASC